MTIILIYTTIWLVVLHLKGLSLFRFDSIYTLMLFLSSCLVTLPILEYPQAVSLQTQTLILITHFCICAGFNSVGHDRKGKASRVPFRSEIRRYPFFETVLAGMALLFLGVMAADWAVRGHIPVLGYLNTVADIRANLDFTNVQRNPLQQLAALLGHFTFIYVILSPLYALGNRRKICFAMLCGIALADLSIAVGGRATIVLLALATLAVFVSLSQFNLRKRLLIGASVGLVFYLLGGVFYLLRNPNFTQAPEFFLALNCAGARYHPLLQNGADVVKAMALSSCYFSSPALNLQAFMASVGDDWTPRLGSYSLSILFRDEFVNTRQEIAIIFASLGMGTNPWATFARDLFIDFGYMLIFPGVLIGILLRQMLSGVMAMSDLGLARLGILACAGFFAAFMSPFIIRSITYPLLLTLILPLVLPLIPSRARPSGTRAAAKQLSTTQP